MINWIIISIISVLSGFYIARYNLHMFQLNSYKVTEYLSWFKTNIRLQWSLIIGIALSVINLFIHSIIINIIICLLLIFYSWVYYIYKKVNNKTPLVITARIKRLITIIIIINLTLIIVNYIYIKSYELMSILSICQIIIMIISNIIAIPLESLIKKYYINSAKNILSENKDLIVIGITGSYGKTSVKNYLKTILQNDYNVLSTPGNYNTLMGVVKTIRNDLKPYHEIFICEMGARHQHDIEKICNLVKPTHGIITSIGPQHLSTFKSMHNIQKTKFELANYIKDSNYLLLNNDCELIHNKINKYKNAITYSIDTNSNFKAINIKINTTGSYFTLANENNYENFYIPLIGKHNIINIIASIVLSNKLGVSTKTIKRIISRLQPVEHRFQIKNISNNTTIIDDAYNSNPVSSTEALNTLKTFNGYKIIITPGLIELGKEEYKYNYSFMEKIINTCDYIIIVDSNISKPLKDAIRKNNITNKKYTITKSFNEAYQHALNINSNKQHKFILIENDLPDQYKG